MTTPNTIKINSPPLSNKIFTTPHQIEEIQLQNSWDVVNSNIKPLNAYEVQNPNFNDDKILPQGCYNLKLVLKNKNQENMQYDGTFRVQFLKNAIISSGDLYNTHLNSESLGVKDTPDQIKQIPIFPIKDYTFYLRVIDINRSKVSGSIQIDFELWKYIQTEIKWVQSGIHQTSIQYCSDANIKWLDSVFLSGKISDEQGSEVGSITMGLVSRYLRKATIRMDKEIDSIWPLDNDKGLDWKQVFSMVGWDLNVRKENTSIIGHGKPWTEAELHDIMLKTNDADLNKIWQYHLFCAKEIFGGTGNMYDHSSTDTNKISREGAAIASHYRYPKSPVYTTIQDVLAMDSKEIYFRTAVHEISHAMGLQHFWWDNGFMNTSRIISMDSKSDSSKLFPNNIKWSFANHHYLMLAHMPDIWVRPGGIPFGFLYDTTPTASINYNLSKTENTINVLRKENKQSLLNPEKNLLNQSRVQWITVVSSISGLYIGFTTMSSGEIFMIELSMGENKETNHVTGLSRVEGKLFKISRNEKQLLNEWNNSTDPVYSITLVDVWNMEIPKTVMVETEITIIGPLRWTNPGHLLTEMMIRIELDNSVPKEIANISYVEIGQEFVESQLKRVTKSGHTQTT